MNNQCGKNQDEKTVEGFEVPTSPDASYDNLYPEDDPEEEPPLLPPQLHQTLLNYPTGTNLPASLPSPQNVILNHVYCNYRETQRSVVAVGLTHRFRKKYVTVVLYKPTPGSGCASG